MEVENVSRFFTFYCIFFDRFGRIATFLRLNIVHVSHRFMYELFRIGSSADGNCYVCAFLILNKSFLNSLILFWSMSLSLTQARTENFRVVSFVQSFNFILLKFQSVCSFILSFLQRTAFLAEYFDRKVSFFALKDAYFSLGRYVLEVKKSTVSRQ